MSGPGDSGKPPSTPDEILERKNGGHRPRSPHHTRRCTMIDLESIRARLQIKGTPCDGCRDCDCIEAHDQHRDDIEALLAEVERLRRVLLGVKVNNHDNLRGRSVLD